jgi:hypothetical protein
VVDMGDDREVADAFLAFVVVVFLHPIHSFRMNIVSFKNDLSKRKQGLIQFSPLLKLENVLHFRP